MSAPVSVGRIVLYVPESGPTKPLAALVTAVRDKGIGWCDLAVFGKRGSEPLPPGTTAGVYIRGDAATISGCNIATGESVAFNVAKVPFSPKKTRGTWHWPKRTEA